MLSDQTIKKIKNDAIFSEYKDWVLEEIEKLNSVEDLGDLSNERAGEKAKVRLLAVKLLVELLDPILDFNEKKEPSIMEIQGAKKKHGL